MAMKDYPAPPDADLPHRTDPAVRDLICQAQAGSGEAHRTLRIKYRPLLDAQIARFSVSEMTRQERADLREEAERVFLTAISSYDTTQDAVDFGLYAKICLRNGLISEWRRMEARRKVLTVPLQEEPTTREDPSARLVEEEGFRRLCQIVRSYLSDFENRVWWQYVTGVPVSEIAEGLGCDEKSVHNAIYRIRRKLREKLTVQDE